MENNTWISSILIDLQKTKIDVFTSPFVLDTIPAIFIIIRNSLQKKECRNHADDGRTAIFRTRHQEKILNACAGS